MPVSDSGEAVAGKIFINYRRGDDAGFAQALFAHLTQAFPPEALFMDVDNIEPGLDFVRVLNEQVAQCDVLISVIGKDWIEARDEAGTRRLDNPDDFVRVEIESALNQDKRVIPVLVGQAQMPKPDQLPETMKPLARRNAVRLSHERFRSDTQGLIAALQRALESVEDARKAEAEVARLAAEANERRDEERKRDERAQQELESQRKAEQLPKKIEEREAEALNPLQDGEEADGLVVRLRARHSPVIGLAIGLAVFGAIGVWAFNRQTTPVPVLPTPVAVAPVPVQAPAAAPASPRPSPAPAPSSPPAAQSKPEAAGKLPESVPSPEPAPEPSAAPAAQSKSDPAAKLPEPPPSPAPNASASIAVTPLSRISELTLKPKDTFRECANCPEMIVVPAGSYTMGSPGFETGEYPHEGPQHRVTLARPFAVAKFALTFDDWDACAAAGGCGGYKPGDAGWGRGRRPVINVSWHDAEAYVAWLAKLTGKPYRLLTEAEYEYAARGGTRTDYPSGGANCKGCGSQWDSKQTAPVGSFAANGFGLYDMAGNVWEWTEDCYHDSYKGAPADGSAWTGGDCGNRVERGGSWFLTPDYLRFPSRNRLATGYRDDNLGFRVARTLLAR
jgi:formylglycine-generating enzyme required for sulfatase activity